MHGHYGVTLVHVGFHHDWIEHLCAVVDLPLERHIVNVRARRTLLRIWHRKTLSSKSLNQDAIADVKEGCSNTPARAGMGSINLAALPGCPACLANSKSDNRRSRTVQREESPVAWNTVGGVQTIG